MNELIDVNNIIFFSLQLLQPSMVRLLESLSKTLRFFHRFFFLSIFFYHKLYSLFLSLHAKNKTLAHLLLSVGNHPRVVLHERERKMSVCKVGMLESQCIFTCFSVFVESIIVISFQDEEHSNQSLKVFILNFIFFLFKRNNTICSNANIMPLNFCIRRRTWPQMLRQNI